MTPPSPSDAFAAAVFAAGLEYGLLRREDVIAWADGHIETLPGPPPTWLIDLSLARDTNLEDLLGLLGRLGGGVDPVAVCRAVYALVPEASPGSVAEAEAAARRIYQITLDLLAGDWTRPLLCEADALEDNFDFARQGYVDKTEAEAAADVAAFLRKHRDAANLPAGLRVRRGGHER